MTPPPGEWFADADLWAAFQQPLFGSDPGASARTHVAAITSLLSLGPGVPVLDLCCGAGRHSLELARRGFAVTGVDLNRDYIAQASAAAAAERLDVEFVAEDARTFVRPSAFAVALSLFTSFGYFDDVHDDLRVLQNVRASLKPGGRLLIETSGKEVIARRGPRRTWQRLGEGDELLLSSERVAGAYERLELHWLLIPAHGSRREARLSIRLYSAVELASLLREAGFTETWIYGSLAGAAYDGRARNLVAVATAPG